MVEKMVATVKNLLQYQEDRAIMCLLKMAPLRACGGDPAEDTFYRPLRVVFINRPGRRSGRIEVRFG